MFNSTLYALAFGLYLNNLKSAEFHGDAVASRRFLCIIGEIICRASNHGYVIHWDEGWQFIKR